jgi:hypothetical protein
MLRALLSLLLVVASALAAERVTFDFGWRFQLGERAPCCGTETVPGQKSNPAPAPAPAMKGPASTNYNDTKWSQVQVPHDYLIGLPYSNYTNRAKNYTKSFKNGFLPRYDGFYRKHFSLPARWVANASGEGNTFRLVFDGIYKIAMVWVNGVYVKQYGDSSAAYTSFIVPLNERHGLRGGSNTIAIHIDGSYGTEHWYTGAGIYRHVWLESTPPVHIADSGLFAPVTLDSLGGSGSVTPLVELSNEATTPSDQVTVSASLYLAGKQVGATVTGHITTIPGGQQRQLVNLGKIQVEQPSTWSIRSPALYTLAATVTVFGKQASEERLNISIGFRDLRWSHSTGLSMNGARVKIRGFCNHNDFAGLGMAVAERVDLFRVQALRGVGGNAWRTSHNPTRASLYDTMDRLGVLVLDETRDLNAVQLPAFERMVREHRNHPSIMAWSLCNEGGCAQANGNHSLGSTFAAAARMLDGTRAVAANMQHKINECGPSKDQACWGRGTLSDLLDVQGLSHPPAQIMDTVHANETSKALIASECCSCSTMRGENHANTSAVRPVPSSFNADCLSEQVNRSDEGRPWSAGTMVWTLFDYWVSGLQVQPVRKVF